jgi:predicted Zn-ribbon and HTH transcriptional regulator
MCQAAAPLPSGEANRRTKLEVADVFRQFAAEYCRRYSPDLEQRRVIRDILICRTEALGGHVYTCDECGHEIQAFNSCLNRHCPKCQCLRQAKWIADRQKRLLPVDYFHVIFTLPAQLRPVALGNKRVLFDLLFAAVAETLLQFAANERWIGGQPALTAVLHSWTRELQFHPHLHCIVSAGGLSPDQQSWLPSKFGAEYLFPEAALAKVFRAKFIEALEKAFAEGKIQLRRPYEERTEQTAFRQLRYSLFQQHWHVHAEKPFIGVAGVVKYLGRYIHRVAISNQRLISLDEKGVTFYTKEGRSITLAPLEFMRRFLLHLLPKGFRKVHHYGLFSPGNVNGRLQIALDLLRRDQEPGSGSAVEQAEDENTPAAEFDGAPPEEATVRDGAKCPQCKAGTLHRRTVAPLPPHRRNILQLARGP